MIKFILSQSAFMFVLVMALAVDLTFSSTVKKRNLEDLTKEARLVVQGTCISSSSRWNAQHTEIYSYSRIKVERILKGGITTNEVQIRQLGGTVDDITMDVPGVSYLYPNETVILFLEPVSNESGVYWTIGLSQGKFTVVKDEKSGKSHVFSSAFGLSILDTETGEVTSVAKDKAIPKRLMVNEFMSKIQEFIFKR